MVDGCCRLTNRHAAQPLDKEEEQGVVGSAPARAQEAGRILREVPLPPANRRERRSDGSWPGRDRSTRNILKMKKAFCHVVRRPCAPLRALSSPPAPSARRATFASSCRAALSCPRKSPQLIASLSFTGQTRLVTVNASHTPSGGRPKQSADPAGRLLIYYSSSAGANSVILRRRLLVKEARLLRGSRLGLVLVIHAGARHLVAEQRGGVDGRLGRHQKSDGLDLDGGEGCV